MLYANSLEAGRQAGYSYLKYVSTLRDTAAGSATITNDFINANQVNSSGSALGGGIASQNSVLSLTNCTVNANQANGATALGGGIDALDSTVDVQSCTVNGNNANGTALGEGGGIYSSGGVLTLVASTVKVIKATTAFDDIFDGP
jgi:fibronectin-binding autotransporter adhesin